jgi:dipeptidyl aminopeptidase/acylaminoacyl peptidase
MEGANMISKKLIIMKLFLFFSISLFGAELPIENWLISQAKIFKPHFTAESFSLFDYYSLNIKSLWPSEGQKFFWDSQQSITWERVKANEGKLSLPLKDGLILVLAATYLDVQRWQEASLSVKSIFPFQIFLDGELIGKTEKTDMTLTRGKHRLLIASFQDKAKDGTLQVFLQFEEKYKTMAPKAVIDPAHNITLLEAFTMPELNGLQVAPGGSFCAILDSDGGLEIRSLPDGSLLKTIFLPDQISSFSWSPEGNGLAIVTMDEKRLCDLWLVNLKDGSTKKLVSEIEGMAQLNWLPDGKFITYTTAEVSKEKRPYELVDNFFDRWDGWKTKVYLCMVSVESGTRHMISGGLNPYGQSSREALVSPDGKKVVFVNETPSSAYPYSHIELWVTNMMSGESELISEIKTSMISSMVWSADSTRLAVIAPYYNFPLKPSDMTNYHTKWHQGIQLWDVSKKSYRYLTKPEFNPCVRSLWWNSKDNKLYFIALDRTVHRLYRFSSDLNEFSEIRLPFKNIEALYGGKDSDWVILRLAEIDKPSWLVSLNLETLESQKIWDKGQNFLSSVRFGKYEMFSFQNRGGTKLDGWIYFPPGFDPVKKYPTIISYYGGFSPRTQSMESQFGRVNHWLAGNGYIVYTFTPTGGYGYGQEFADAHVLEEGAITGPDVIDAVTALIRAKPYVNSKKIGGFGHSQGGFLSLSLVTQTNLFTTVVASGVISNILSYFFNVLGQPNSDEIGLPGVYPWNRKDFYVNCSPVFNADKVSTPVLLMQGTDDPWTEMIESDQMYSALKVQGKDVVQIRWIGEGHGISKLSNRILNEKIRLEWFDKYLKDEPESWQERLNISRK